MAARDNQGKFAKGNPGSPGRKPRAVEEAYLKAIVRAMPQKDWRVVLEKVKQLAMRGERWAVEFYADRLMGKPVQAVTAEHSGDVRFVVEYADGLPDNPTEAA